MRTSPRVLVAVTVALSATCAGDRRGVRVLADPALAGALDDVARAFEGRRPGAPVLVEAATGAELPRRLEGPGVDLVATDDVPRDALEALEIREAVDETARQAEDGAEVVERVARGGADAGIAWATDVGPGVRVRVRVLDLPERVSIRGVYAIVLAADPPHPIRAAEFVEFALSAERRRILAARGFGPP